MNTKEKGEISEGLILAKFLEMGRAVSLPFGNSQRYDMIVDEAGTLVKVQCKTGWIREGCVRFATCSFDGKKYKSQHYRKQVDAFIVYCPDNKKFYRVPVLAVGSAKAYLRLEKPKNGQNKRINLASDFEF